MASYYVHIPGSQAPTAEVEASSTKHARTAYLDYLSRNGLIGWRDRQTVRSGIKVDRMSPGEFQTQIKLEYDMVKEPEYEMQAPTRHLEEYDEGEMTPDEREEYHTTRLEDTSEDQPGDPFNNSPIARLSRQTGGR